jgi:hypothetical protein
MQVFVFASTLQRWEEEKSRKGVKAQRDLRWFAVTQRKNGALLASASSSRRCAFA